jgi:hypothetical protein
MDKVRYLRLTDYDHRGEIVKQVGRKFFLMKKDSMTRIGLGPYFYPDAPEFECYEEISEEEANKIIEVM